MSFTHNILLGVSTPLGAIQKSVAKTSGMTNNVDESIPIDASDLQVNWASVVSQQESVVILVDQVLTIKDHTGAAWTITTVANEPYIWYKGSYFANLMTADTTHLLVTNASGVIARLQIWCIEDPTV